MSILLSWLAVGLEEDIDGEEGREEGGGVPSSGDNRSRIGGGASISLGSKGNSPDSLSQGDGCLLEGTKNQRDNRCVSPRGLGTAEREGAGGEERYPSSQHTEE